jgi:hypothetical protein
MPVDVTIDITVHVTVQVTVHVTVDVIVVDITEYFTKNQNTHFSILMSQ